MDIEILSWGGDAEYKNSLFFSQTTPGPKTPDSSGSDICLYVKKIRNGKNFFFMVKSRFEKKSMRFWAKSYSKIKGFYYRILLKTAPIFFSKRDFTTKKKFFRFRFFFRKVKSMNCKLSNFQLPSSSLWAMAHLQVHMPPPSRYKPK